MGVGAYGGMKAGETSAWLGDIMRLSTSKLFPDG